MCHQKTFQLNWLTGLEVTATGNFDNSQRETERATLSYTDSDKLTPGPSENAPKCFHPKKYGYNSNSKRAILF